MVLHRHPHRFASHTLRVCGLVAAYAFVLVTGTAILIAAFGNQDDGRVTGPGGQQLTAAEVVMQQAALQNDKRGF